MRTLIHERVEQARTGQNPKVICKVPSGWVVLGDVQFLNGYCLLLPDPVVPDLNSLSTEERNIFLRDMTLLGDAISSTTQCSRLNYEILGNSEPALHAHVFPRFAHEQESLRQKPVWFYNWNNARPFDLNLDRKIMADINLILKRQYEDLGIKTVTIPTIKKGLAVPCP